MHVNFVLFEGVTQLDLTGPYEILSRVPDVTLSVVSKSYDLVFSDRQLAIAPSKSLKDASPSDILVIPGGPGVNAAMLDEEWVEFVMSHGISARYIAAICTGSLLLGAAGLLKGKRATSHWMARELLPQFGATISEERCCIDGKLFTAGGVTSGIDMALVLVARVWGEELAKEIQLLIEYDPAPPFSSGSPRVAEQELIERVLGKTKTMREERGSIVEHVLRAEFYK